MCVNPARSALAQPRAGTAVGLDDQRHVAGGEDEQHAQADAQHAQADAQRVVQVRMSLSMC